MNTESLDDRERQLVAEMYGHVGKKNVDKLLLAGFTKAELVNGFLDPDEKIGGFRRRPVAFQMVSAYLKTKALLNHYGEENSEGIAATLVAPMFAPDSVDVSLNTSDVNITGLPDVGVNVLSDVDVLIRSIPDK